MILDNESFSLSPDLMKAIAPNASSNAYVKFDDKGTLHVMERDKEGKLMKDYALQRMVESVTPQYPSKREEISKIHEKSKYYKILYILILVMLGLLCSISLIIIHAYGII